MIEMAKQPYIAGLTTNPTLMRKAGITDYRGFALDVPPDCPMLAPPTAEELALLDAVDPRGVRRQEFHGG